MKVIGFSFIRNAIKYDYPIVESLQSILPLCDEVVLAVGESEDETLALVSSISPKIKILKTVWDDSKREGGAVLAEETNKAFAKIAEDADWAFYIQGDEVIHEGDHKQIKASMLQWKDDPKTEGLLFDYLHFYGSYDFIGASPRWYPHEVRIIRPSKNIFSYRDAQGFRKEPNDKLMVRSTGAKMHHYGWVKDPRKMQAKQESFNKYWHDDQWMKANVAKRESFNYGEIDALEKFEGTHPKCMRERIERVNWAFDFDPSFNKMRLKDRFKSWVKKWTGWELGRYSNYKLIK